MEIPKASENFLSQSARDVLSSTSTDFPLESRFLHMKRRSWPTCKNTIEDLGNTKQKHLDERKHQLAVEEETMLYQQPSPEVFSIVLDFHRKDWQLAGER
jgi:hypothetical protein